MKTRAKILVVEDNEGEIILMLDAFEAAGVVNEIISLRNGELALQYLKKEGEFSNADTPLLVLLDLNLPKLNGLEVLEKIKNDRSLMHIPVIMLSTSSSVSDIREAYNRRSNCFITKPSDYDSFKHMIEMVKNFWIDTAALPYTADFV